MMKRLSYHPINHFQQGWWTSTSGAWLFGIQLWRQEQVRKHARAMACVVFWLPSFLNFFPGMIYIYMYICVSYPLPILLQSHPLSILSRLIIHTLYIGRSGSMCTRCVHPKQLGWLGQNVYYLDFRFRISLSVADFMLSPAYICVQASIV